MKLQFRSLQFLSKLEELKAAATSPVISAAIVVPDEMMWWAFLEFGTGIRGDNPTEGYTIEPIEARLLHFFNVALGKEEFRESVFMPGIPAFHMITTIETEIQEYIRTFVRETLQSSDYNMTQLQQLFITEAMPKIKEMIVESFGENLPNHTREFGRLSTTATAAFENESFIRDNSEGS